MKKKNPGTDSNRPEHKKKMLENNDSAPKNQSSQDNIPMNQGKGNKKQPSPAGRKKPDQIQPECLDLLPKQELGRIPDDYQGNDERVFPEQGLGRIPNENREEVEEKLKK